MFALPAFVTFILLMIIAVAALATINKRKLIGSFLIAIFLSMMGWVIVSATLPREIERFEYIPIGTTKLAGKQIQVFLYKGQFKNANEQFGQIIPEDHVVKRNIYKTNYLWINWHPIPDSFELVPIPK